MMLNMVQKLILGHRQRIMSRRELRETISKQNKEERALSPHQEQENKPNKTYYSPFTALSLIQITLRAYLCLYIGA